MFDFD